MEELIKRLERVIATGAPDKDGMHPISAETMLEVVKELSELGMNLASLGTDCISRQQAIEALYHVDEYNGRSVEAIRNLLPAEPQIIRCKDCKYASGNSRICLKLGHSPIGELDFCSYAERRWR